MTIRFPEELLDAMRDVKADDESLNDMVVTTLAREVARRRGLELFEEINRYREQIRARVGLQPDSTELIRAFREGRERHG